VKTVQTGVDIEELARVADAETDSYAFSTAGAYDGDRARLTEIITPKTCWMAGDKPYILPARIRSLFDMACG
jgi:hypothetical protein